jgi:hypothetical protein
MITNPFVWLYLSTDGPPFISELGWQSMDSNRHANRVDWLNIRALLGFVLTEAAMIFILIGGGICFSDSKDKEGESHE